MKKGLLVLGTLLMGVCSVWAQQFSVANGDGKMIYYSVTDVANHEVEVVAEGNVGYSGAIVIPASVEYEGVTYDVRSVGGSAFKDCVGVSAVTLPNSLERIGGFAFAGCGGLAEVAIPNSVTTMGSFAFQDCSGLRSVTIGDGVVAVGKYDFYGCSGLEVLSLGSGVDTIKKSAFWGCSSLESVTIPNGVTVIEGSAFRDCVGLVSLTLGEGVTTIEDYAFSGCIGLSSMVLGDGVTTLGEYAFSGCVGLTSVTLGSGIRTIERCVFRDCSGLQLVEMGDGVETIEKWAFMDCSSLESVTIPQGVTMINSGAFVNDISIRTVYWNAESVDQFICADETGFEMHPFEGTPIERVVFGDGVRTIPALAFEGFVTLKGLEIGSGMETIAGRAFGGCTGLEWMRVRAVEPPTIGGSTFDQVGDGIPVYVPCESLIRYMEDDKWSYFRNVQCDNNEGVEDVVMTEVRVYPNPTNGVVWVEAESVERIEVMDMAGKIVDVVVGKECVDMAELGSGVYVLRIVTAKGVAMRRVVRN